MEPFFLFGMTVLSVKRIFLEFDGEESWMFEQAGFWAGLRQ